MNGLPGKLTDLKEARMRNRSLYSRGSEERPVLKKNMSGMLVSELKDKITELDLFK